MPLEVNWTLGKGQFHTILQALITRRQHIRQGIRKGTKKQIDLIEVEALIIDARSMRDAQYDKNNG